MSRTVDNRVVEMGFDNKQFESGVKTSIDSLNNLKKGLQLDESARSLRNLNEAGRTFSLSGISDGVQNISNKFSALGVIGFTIMQNLTNAALDFGKKIMASITQPMKSGFAEYETQMNAIQTTLANTASKGTTLEDVNKALDQLNTYADKTIYNFSEMTKNIGTFTAAGISLETSVEAIKGIANLAAVSGSNSQQASTAMYQLSQALSSGTVKLMDWNSVVNAGMGGQVFQDALKETARLHKVNIDDMIKREGSFRNTLQNGWLTSEILTETLAKFTGDLTESQLKTMGYTDEQIAGIIKLGETANDAATKVKTLSQLQETIKEALQSGWAKSWSILIGDFEEAKVFFTEVSDTVGGFVQRSSDSRNEVLQAWKDWGGRAVLIHSLREAFNGLLKIAKPISEAFTEIFPPNTLENLKNITVAIYKLSQLFQINEKTASQLKRIFKGLFATLDIVRLAVDPLIQSLMKLIGPKLKPGANSILTFLANIGDKMVGVRESIIQNNTFGKALEKVGVYVGNLAGKISIFGSSVKEHFGAAIKRFTVFMKIAKDIGLFKNIGQDLKNVGTKISDFFKSLSNIDTSIFTGFAERVSARFGPLGKQLSETFGKFFAFVGTEFKKKMAQGTKKMADIGEFIGSIIKFLQEGLAKIDFGDFEFAKNFDFLNAALTGGLILTLKNFVSKGTSAFDGLAGMFTSVKGVIDSSSGVLNNISGILGGVTDTFKAMQDNLRAGILTKIAVAIGLLALSLIALSLIDSKKLTIALVALTTLFTDLFTAMALYEKVSGTKGFVSITGAVGAMIGIAGAMLILTVALKRLSDMDPEKLKFGMLSLTGILAALVLFVRGFNTVKINPASGLAMIGISVAILILTKAVEKFGEMDQTKMTQGLIAIAAMLAEIGLFSRLTANVKTLFSSAIGLTILGGALFLFGEVITRMGKLSWEEIGKGLAVIGGSLGLIGAAMQLFPKDMMIKAVGLTIVALALTVLAKVLTSMGSMGWNEIARGLAVLGGAMLILAIGINAMQGAVMGAIALGIIAVALAVLTPVLITLGSMPLAQIGVALLALAGVFIVLGVAGYLLGPVVPILLGLGAAMLLIGIAALAFGAGVAALAAGLAALAISGVAGAGALVAMLGVLLSVIPLIITAVVGGIILFAKLISEGAPEIGKAISAMIIMLAQVIIDTAPKVFESLTVLLRELIKIMRDVVPDFIEAALYLLTELLKSIAEKVPEFVQAGIDIILGLLKGVRDNIFEIVTVAIDIVTEFINAIAAKLPDIIDSGMELIISFIDGLAQGIEDNASDLNAAIGRLATAIVNGLADGLASGVGGVVEAIGKLGGAAIDALKTLLGIFSPSRVFTILGELTGEGFVNGILVMVTSVGKAVKTLGEKAVNGVSSAVDTIGEALTGDLDMSPTIRPVVDLTDVQNGRKELDDLFGKKALKLPVTISKLSDVSNNMSNADTKNGSDSPAAGSITLTQINNSPKELSRIEIYRDTKNLLHTLKGLVPTK